MAAVLRRNAVTPTPTGSNTQGSPPRRGRGGGDRHRPPCSLVMVPIFTSSAPAMRDDLRRLLRRMRHQGAAPAASSPFAVVFMTTALVMLCTSGRVLRMAASTAAGACSLCPAGTPVE